MDFFKTLFKHSNKGEIGVSGLNNELSAIYIYSLFARNKQDILVITNTLYEANKLYDSIITYTDNAFFFPMDDFLTSEAIASSPDLKMIRLNTITNTLNNRPKIIVTNLMGALRYLPRKRAWEDSIVTLKVNNEYDINLLIENLYKIGYYREILVSKVGEIGARGYILDIFPIDEDNPIRIQFFGDVIESIRYFDIDTQRSISNLDLIKIKPFDEFIYDFELEEIERKQKNLPLVTSSAVSIKDYLNNPIMIYKDYNQIINGELLLRQEIFNYHTDKDLECSTNYMFELNDIKVEKNIYLMSLENILTNVKLDSIEKYNVKDIVPYNNKIGNIKEKILSLAKQNKTIVIALDDEKQIKKIKLLLGESLILTDENRIFSNKINLIKKSSGEGFILDNIVLLTKYELFNQKSEGLGIKKKFTSSVKRRDINRFAIDDYVVHERYGIGVYRGLATLSKENVVKDYIQILYSGNDKLYIPVENIEFISKFSGREGAKPKISKLGGSEWQKAKLKLRNKIQDIAGQLLKLSAERENSVGYAYNSDTPEQLTFEKGFIYEETPDQLKATLEIKEDMEKAMPMDRILCGDVGYGKTEVAFRAIFKAVIDSKQVAYLCPTTILSRQQYESAIERFSGWPIKIELLNRFTPLKKAEEIINGLKEGVIDVIFGTHKLLNNKIEFKDLGLLIIDEEQRFGVLQKEKIKQYKTNVDILTLSATPIPRTLQMSIVGLRDLSLIETPPVNRYPIQTYVLEQNNEIIKQAIYKEMARSGQSFVLYNRVADITTKAELIKKLVPEAKVAYAHGKMGKVELEKIMMEFINKNYDVLVCTTIIETGIDIPNTNTLIVMDADRYGLSQLYQLRGRVGRSDRIAFAYLMYNPGKVLGETASKRLKVIKNFTALGSGFAIAARDLSIRGAGDILGREQAGFIDTVGIDLYLKLLNDEINKLKGHESKTKKEPDNYLPLINIDTHIRDNYVFDDDLKIEIHQKINEIDSVTKLNEVKEELEDRFGRVNEEILIYMYEELFEGLAKKYQIIKVNYAKGYIELVFSEEMSEKINKAILFEIAYHISTEFILRCKSKQILVRLKLDKLDKHYLYYIIEFIQSLEELVE
ncbi:MAG: transcription-repair coupling factor [Bacilli bacterium]|nr:transcription-repair coupling factor [Bacilli bacterium]